MAVLAAILNSVPEKARSAVLRALKGISSNSTSATRVLFSGIAGLPKHTQDDLEQCCVVGEHQLMPETEQADEQMTLWWSDGSWRTCSRA